MTNPTLKLLIKDCINSKRLRITLIKVKGHSNNELNDIADRLAKEGLYGPLLTLDFNLDHLFFNLDNISFRPYWNTNPIEHRLRPFIKTLNNSVIESRWATSKGVRDSLFLVGRPIDCNFAWAALHRTSHH